jgi:hypothetical protein
MRHRSVERPLRFPKSGIRVKGGFGDIGAEGVHGLFQSLSQILIGSFSARAHGMLHRCLAIAKIGLLVGA